MSFQPTDPHYEDRVRASFAGPRFIDLLGAQLIAVRPVLSLHDFPLFCLKFVIG
jgi:hypothetical protein